MIEAMACGTPVIAYEGGAVGEVIEQGRTGFVVTELEDAIEAVRRVPDLSRARSREIFEERFTVTRMATDYLKVYMRIIDSRMRKLDRCTKSSLRAVSDAQAKQADARANGKTPA
jgi:glycosyltransferase involved in cell wall biosynthesis